jgi:hypothetical protein
MDEAFQLDSSQPRWPDLETNTGYESLRVLAIRNPLGKRIVFRPGRARWDGGDLGQGTTSDRSTTDLRRSAVSPRHAASDFRYPRLV